MNRPNQGFEAFLYHPDLGNEMAQGILFIDPRKLQFESVRLTVDIPLERLVIKCDEETDRILFIDRGQPMIQCFTTDAAILNHWALRQSNHTRPQLQRLAATNDMSRRVKLTLYALLGCALVVWVGSYAFDLVVRTVVKQIPPEWERKFGDEQLVKLREKLDFLDDTNREAQLAFLATPLTSRIPGGADQFKFHLIDEIEPNALALPGGHVMVTTGLLETTDRPEELLGVIAHEIAHVKRRHAFQQAISGAGPVLVLRILLSDQNNRMNLMGQLSGLLIYQSFSQSHEREADDTGWDYLVAAHINPHGMIDMLNKLRAEVGDESERWEAFSSHPALEKRIRRLEARWDRLPNKTGFLVLTNAVAAPPPDHPEQQLRKLLHAH